MKIPSIRWGTLQVPFSLAVLTSVAAAAPLQAQGPASLTSTPTAPAHDWANAPASVRGSLSSDLDRQVLFDEAADGSLWARGAGYKAQFKGTGATIIPFLGSQAPANHPLAMRVASATSAGVSVLGSEPISAKRDGQTIRIDHKTFVEAYDLTPAGIEQRFVFDALPERGELVVRLDVTSDLEGSDLGSTLRFENELGRIDYGAASAIDAKGQRIQLDSTLVDGAIQLTVPAEFVMQATMPLTIDPLITFYTVSGGPRTELTPDVSYDSTRDQWCIVWTDVWTTSDYDIYARIATGDFTLGPVYTIDFTTDFWTTPKIADNSLVNEYLIVAAVVPAPVASNPATIRGRILDGGPGVIGPVIQISPVDGAYRNAPDVGGDGNEFPFGSNNYCVVWQRPLSIAVVNIESQIVTTNSTLSGSMITLDNTGTYNELPRISKSVGQGAIAQPYNWTVVWQRRISTNNHDIYGTKVYWSGGAANPVYPIDTSFQDDTVPAVSTIMDPLNTFNERPYMVVYQRAFTDSDIIATVLVGSQVILNTDLASTYPVPTGNYDQTLPSVDCDGVHFLVSYVEHAPFPSTDTNVLVSDYSLSGNALMRCTDHQSFAGSPVAESAPAVCAMGSSGGAKQHFLTAWTYASINNSTDIQAGLWDSCLGGNQTPFCFGDGSGTACPCGNSGASGHGCAASLSPSGAVLAATGSATLSGDTLTLVATGMGPNSPCLYFQGTANVSGGAGSVFGDGLRCIAGTTRRLGHVTNSGAGASSFNGLPATDLSIQSGLPSGGGRIYYQVWFRDAGAFCTTSTFNLTNGLQVDWGW